MSILTLAPDNRKQLIDWLNDDVRWTIACLCAAWCDTCGTYRAGFEALAARHPEQYFAWIDIEEQADWMGDLDVDNFPTLLIERGNLVAFFGAVLPDQALADRLLRAQLEKSEAELLAEAFGSTQHRDWQRNCNLRKRLAQASDL